jgi:hypothetical protein
MRGVFAAFVCIFSVPLFAADLEEALLSNRAALVSADTPPEVIAYMCDDLNALVLVPQGEQLGRLPKSKFALLPLPTLPRDSITAVDSLRAWRRRYGAGVALLPKDRRSGAVWTEALTGEARLYKRTSEFANGDIAVPIKDGYAIYRGPANRFFVDDSRPFAPDISDTIGHDRTWSAFSARAMNVAALLESSSEQAQVDSIASLVRVAESLDASAHPLRGIARAYAWRWRHVLGLRLAPTCDAPVIETFSSVPTPQSFSFHSDGPIVLQIDSLRFTGDGIEIKWNTSFPQTVQPGQPLTVEGVVTARGSNPTTRLWCSYSHAGVDLHTCTEVHVKVRAAIEAAFDPPILFADDDFTRSDPDYLIRVATGNVTLANRTSKAIHVNLNWKADSTLSITSPDKQLDLAPGKTERVSYTLSLPRELKRKQYTFSVAATDSAGTAATVTGQLWATRPRVKDEPRAAVLGDAGLWLRALRALGIDAYPLASNSLADADLTEFTAVIISGDAAAPDEKAKTAVRKLAEEGNLVIVSLSENSAAWLPWAAPWELRPAPTQTKFHKPEMGWWHSPNTLVGNSFASPDSELAYTLPAGTPDWEPLAVSSGGKGFMYRRPVGKGWFVVVHGGWAKALERYERPALLGLANLVGR